MGRPDDLEEVTRADGRMSTRTMSGERRLVLLVLGPSGIRELELSMTKAVKVGRAATADLHIDDPSVSRLHAEIVPGPTGLVLRDLGSRNGTFVGGKPVPPEGVALHVGAEIEFGTVSARLHAFKHRGAEMARLLTLPELEARILEDGERGLRFDLSLAVMSIEVTGSKKALEPAHEIVGHLLRSIDAYAVTGLGRVDLLLVETAKAEALALAGRIESTLRDKGYEARLGVAAFPGDAPAPDHLLLAARHALRQTKASGVMAARDAARTVRMGEREVVVADPQMVRLFALVERLAAVDLPVLVTGETGSGKEIVAEALHAMGPRGERNLVKLNCAALPENLLESELFGHERGAFSGALTAKPGLFEQAEGGTLFLDEIGELAPALQAKLLRVLEDHRVRRVGALTDTKIDVRIVAATHRNLKSSGTFREDLYYRLSGMTVAVPPLRDRPRDLPFLAEKLAGEAAKATKREPLSIDEATFAALRAYAWPGNIRELKNVIGRAVMLCDGDTILPSHLPPELTVAPAPVEAPRPAPARLDEEVKDLERRRLIEALDACDQNQTRAAELLKMPRRTFVAKMAALGIDGPRRRRTP